jgi:hypothetical protein
MDKIKKVKKKNGKKFDPPPLGFEPQIFEQNYPAKIWILRMIRSIELTVFKKSRL